ncbi:MAG: QueT transporter family protein [Oscillospiraceae bacterium]|nr:QueT transporter family protein [Oscillospiraceae bacterium]
MKKTSLLSRAGLIAAVYAVLTLAFPVLSYGPIQLRVSEALVLLPVVMPESVLGLTFGCLVANTVGVFWGYSLPWDMVMGTFATFIAAVITRKIKNKWLAPLPAVLSNGLIVGTMITYIILPEAEAAPLWYNILTVGAGEAIVSYALGIPLFNIIRKNLRK